MSTTIVNPNYTPRGDEEVLARVFDNDKQSLRVTTVTTPFTSTSTSTTTT